MRVQPVVFTWRRVEVVDEHGEVHRALAMVPTQRYRGVSVRQYGEEGSEHTLVPFEARNMRMHAACFAELGDLYDNLPETVWYLTDADGKFVLDDGGERVVRFPSAEHFRKWLLIDTGWCESKEIECANRQHARELAKWLRVEDEYARIRVAGCHVTVKKAVSQNLSSMSSRDFKSSMDAILDRARSYVGVSATASRGSAGRAA